MADATAVEDYFILSDGRYVLKNGGKKVSKNTLNCYLIEESVAKGRLYAQINKYKIYSKQDLIQVLKDSEENSDFILIRCWGEIRSTKAQKSVADMLDIVFLTKTGERVLILTLI